MIPKSARPASKSVSVSACKVEAKHKERKEEGKMSKTCGVRHVREVVTRTVTYQVSGAGKKGAMEGEVRMSPAPRGKRRRLVSGAVKRELEMQEMELKEEQ